MDRPNPVGEGDRLFVTTCWTLVLASAQTEASGANDALSELCRLYWSPLYIFVRRRGYDVHRAQDLVQGFFLHLLENRVISMADRERGRFRTFLLSCLRNFLAKDYERANAQKRGGAVEIVPLDAHAVEEFERQAGQAEWEPEEAYDLAWALAVLERARLRLHEEADQKGRAEVFAELRRFLPGATPEPADGALAAAASRLGLGLATLKSAVHRMRLRFRALMREEVARTVEMPDEVDEELRYLRSILGRALRRGAT